MTSDTSSSYDSLLRTGDAKNTRIRSANHARNAHPSNSPIDSKFPRFISSAAPQAPGSRRRTTQNLFNSLADLKGHHHEQMETDQTNRLLTIRMEELENALSSLACLSSLSCLASLSGTMHAAYEPSPETSYTYNFSRTSQPQPWPSSVWIASRPVVEAGHVDGQKAGRYLTAPDPWPSRSKDASESDLKVVDPATLKPLYLESLARHQPLPVTSTKTRFPLFLEIDLEEEEAKRARFTAGRVTR